MEGKLFLEDQTDDIGQGHHAVWDAVIINNEHTVGPGGAKLGNHLEGGVLRLAGENRGAGVQIKPADLVQEVNNRLIQGLVVKQKELKRSE